MKDDDFLDDKKINDTEEKKRRKIPTVFLLIIFTTVGVMFALGLSFSAVNYLNGNETINTIISNIIGDDNKDKYIITYVENIGTGEKGESILKDDFLHIIGAKVSDTKNGATGEVIYFGGLLLSTKNTFPKSGSSVTYEVIIKNDSSTDKNFEKLLFDPNDEVNYTISGIKEGDKIAPGEEKKIYITVEYKDGKDTKYPKTVESSVDITYRKEDKSIHITDAKVNGTTNGGKGEVTYYEGLFISTKNTFESNTSAVSYKITIKNDSDIKEAFSGIVYNPDGDVKYTLTGIKNGDILEPGQSVVIYLLVEPNGDLKYPTTVESSTEVRFTTFTYVDNQNGINLVNQFPTPDEKGKLFEGTNYVYNFSLIVGKKIVGAYYEITAVANDDNNLDSSFVKLYLEKNGKGVDLAYKDNGKIKVFTEYKNSTHSEAEGKVIYSGKVSDEDIQNGKIDFKLRMWVSEDVKINETNTDKYNNKKFGVRINTYAQF